MKMMLFSLILTLAVSTHAASVSLTQKDIYISYINSTLQGSLPVYNQVLSGTVTFDPFPAANDLKVALGADDSAQVYTYDGSYRYVNINRAAHYAFTNKHYYDYAYLYLVYSYGANPSVTSGNGVSALYSQLEQIARDLPSIWAESAVNSTITEAIYEKITDLVETESLNKHNSAPVCDNTHKASVEDCIALLNNLKSDLTSLDGYRAINYATCYISWDKNIDNSIRAHLYNSAYTCLYSCVDIGSGSVSCYETDVILGTTAGTQQCLSNRATGC